MKRLILALLIISLTINAIAQHEQFVCKDMHMLVEMEKQHGASIMKFVANPLTQNYDLKYHRMEWMIDPAQLYVAGVITSYFVPEVANFQQMYFDLSSNLTVDNVIWNGTPINFAQQSGDILVVDFPSALLQGQLDSLSIEYQGTPVGSGFGSFAANDHNGVPVLWTLSEPYGAKEWWPCKQDLNDKIDSIDVIVTTPSGYKAASNGVLESSVQTGNSVAYHWKHRYPIPAYLVAIAVTNYTVYTDLVPVPNASAIEVLNYIYPEQASMVQTQTVDIIEIMQLFNNLFGLYPFADEKYGHAQFGWGGGMEHQTMSFMGGFSYGLQAHELAHQWFGDKITCGSWKDIWLNEGFATYLTGLTNEHLGTATSWMDWKQGQIATITNQPDGSVWVDDTTSVGRIFSGRLSYAKGSMLLHMLRWVVGDDDFYMAINNYLADPTLAFAYAHTPNLQAHLEAQSGISLTEFFTDWFYGEGYPSYDISTVVNGNTLDITIYQTTSDPSVAFYEMPVPIKVWGQGMDSTLRLDHVFSGQTFQLTLPFIVDSVAFDPDLWIISANNTESVLVGIEPVFKEAFVEVYPNPAADIMMIESSSIIKRIEILSGIGSSIFMEEKASRYAELIIKELESGTYFIRVFTEQGIETRKFLKL